MMKKALRYSVPLVLGLLLGAGMAVAGDLAPQVPQPAVAAAPACEAQPPAEAGLFTPEPEAVAICPEIGCFEYCRRDRDCTTSPGGVCNLFCPTQGCCSYPG